jgi:hypothetical protein
MRTTLDLDKPVLDGLKLLKKREKRSLSQLASQLLAEALAAHHTKPSPTSPFVWKTQAMAAKVDLADKDAVHRILDQS